jgi:hypothetical protein
VPLTCHEAGPSRSREYAEASASTEVDVALRLACTIVASRSADAAEASRMPDGVGEKVREAGVAGSECRG